jgi:phospholipase C
VIIISPYAKKGFISHANYEFSSLLKFVELRCGLKTLTERGSHANNMTDSFHFQQPPLAPLVLQIHPCPGQDWLIAKLAKSLKCAGELPARAIQEDPYRQPG